MSSGSTSARVKCATARDKQSDLPLVPINGQKGNMTAEQAARLTAEFDVPFVVPTHYGCLQPADDLVERSLAEFARAAPACIEPGAIASLPLRRP